MDRLFLGPQDVDMLLDPAIYRRVSVWPGPVEDDEIMIHYTVTEACPFNCRGCINALTSGVREADRASFQPKKKDEDDLERDAKGIGQLIEASGKKQAVIVFYGGEPMLRLERMRALGDHLERLNEGSALIRYAVITSGHYLKQAVTRYPELASTLWLTAVSVDGTEQQHDAMRQGTSLATIRAQVASLDQVRTGTVLIWSTLRPGMSLLDCFDSFMYFHERGQAEHFFWHCDEADGLIPDLRGYLDEYRSDLRRIMQAYVACLEKGVLLSVIHLNELILYLLTGKRRGTTACGVEKMANFDVIGDGQVHACADLPEAMHLGHIADSGQITFLGDAKDRLGKLVAYKTDLGCADCGVEPYCGGRCPVQANTGGIGRARQYCFMMREHVQEVKQFIEPIIDLMVANGKTSQDLYRSARYAKFADVTP